MFVRWIRKRPISSVAIAIATLLALFGVRAAFETPRLDRDWVEHLAVMPAIDLRDDEFSLGLATDWAYDAKGPVAKTYTTASERFADLRNVWFVLEPHPGMKPMAHTLLLFEFADDRMIGLTIEARREANEAYSAFWGTFNRFELAYIWSTPKELLTRRAVLLDHDVLVYPLKLDAGQKERFLRRLLTKTIAVSTKPVFYNTLASNCTNELAKSALLGWHYSWVLTGYSAEQLYALGLIPGRTFVDAQANAQMKAQIVAWNSLSSRDFDRALLAELRARLGEQRQAAMDGR
jgi:hypothetical protein